MPNRIRSREQGSTRLPIQVIVRSVGLCAAMLAIFGGLIPPAVQPATSVMSTEPCGALSMSRPPTTFAHVVWIWMENQSYGSVIGGVGSAASLTSPYLNRLAGSCGLAGNYHNVTHPSLPNYIAATSGDVQGLAANCAPRTCPQPAPNLFEQVEQSGGTWRSYVEGMASNCDPVDSGQYTTLVNPAVYYTDVTQNCQEWDVPLGTSSGGALNDALASGDLPSFSFVIPDLCDDTHNCPVSTGDAWLSTWIPKITSSPTYMSGNTVVFITWDEGEASDFAFGENCAANPGAASCHVPAIVLSPFVVAGTFSYVRFSHFSLLRTTEELLGLPALGHAGDAAEQSMSASFHLRPSTPPAGNWEVLVTTSPSLTQAHHAARTAQRALGGDDFVTTVQRGLHGYDVTVLGLYTVDEAQAVRHMLAPHFARTAVRGRTR